MEEENLNDEVDEDVHDGEEEQAGTLMHGNEDATDIFFLLDWGYSILIFYFLLIFNFFYAFNFFFNNWPCLNLRVGHVLSKSEGGFVDKVWPSIHWKVAPVLWRDARALTCTINVVFMLYTSQVSKRQPLGFASV